MATECARRKPKLLRAIFWGSRTVSDFCENKISQSPWANPYARWREGRRSKPSAYLILILGVTLEPFRTRPYHRRL